MLMLYDSQVMTKFKMRTNFISSQRCSLCPWNSMILSFLNLQ
jgi:hypothetical protein